MSATDERLIVKAGLRYHEASKFSIKKALWQLEAFAEVAADVLNIVMAPAQFEIAIIEAHRAVPMPVLTTVSRDTAERRREEWRIDFIAAVYKSINR